MRELHTQPEAERKDARPRVVILTASGLIAGVVFALLAAHWFLAAGGGAGSGVSSLGSAGLFPNGIVQKTSIEEDWSELEVQTREHLSAYVWVDRSSGVVRIPIEQAMARLVQKSGDKKR